MKNSILLPAFLLALATFWGCSSNDAPSPTSPDTIEENQLKGSISGTVTDSVKHGISGVAVTLDSGGFATNTDSLGRYTIPNVPGRTWTVRFTKSNWHDTAVSGVKLAIDEDRIGVDMRMRYTPDSAIAADRQVFGLLTDPTGIVRLEAIVTTNSGTTALKDLTLGANGAFAALLALGIDSGSLKLIARDAEGHATGYVTIPFVAGGTAIQIPAFSPTNAIPKLDAGKDTTIPVGRTILLMAKVHDTLDNSGITSLAWSCGTSTTWTPEGANGFGLALPRDSGSMTCRVRAADKDSNVVNDSLVLHVVNTKAKLLSGPRDTALTPGDNLDLAIQVHDADGIARLIWNYGDGTSDSSSLLGTSHTYPGTSVVPAGTSKPFALSVTVVDSQGGRTNFALATIKDTNDIPTVSVNDTIAEIEKKVKLHAIASDLGLVIQYEWSLDGITFYPGASDTTITLPSSPIVKYPVYVRTKDEDGNTSKVDSIRIGVDQSFTDSRDGQRYRITTIGSQTWMAQNLNFKTDSSFCYNNDIANCTNFGRLYKWSAAMQLDDSCNTKTCVSQIVSKHQGPCPTGWHVPTSAEGMKLTDTTLVNAYAGMNLKAKTGWSITAGGTDSLDFNALPAGRRSGGNSPDYGIGRETYFWHASERDALSAYRWYFGDMPGVTSGPDGKIYAYSLRCVKN